MNKLWNINRSMKDSHKVKSLQFSCYFNIKKWLFTVDSELKLSQICFLEDVHIHG